MKLFIHPSVGVARLGNSKNDYFLLPDIIEKINGYKNNTPNKLRATDSFKDAQGDLKRQGQLFKVFKENGEELTLNAPDVSSITWNVHLTNQKNVVITYPEVAEELWDNNPTITLPQVTLLEKKILVIDLGPRSISGRSQSIAVDVENIPDNYPAICSPQKVDYGMPVTTLGSLLTDEQGRLIVLGGFGNAGGNLDSNQKETHLAWFDDLAEGTVHCCICFKNNTTPIYITAKVMVYPPELLNP
jgi:L-lysine 6-oxidase